MENYWAKPAHFVLDKTVFRRNHIIADLFARIHFGEKMGTGFERIREMCKKENAPFLEIELTENYFYVTFKQIHAYLKMAQEQSPQKILELIKQNPSITRKELSGRIGITEDGVKFHLNKLKEKTAIRRIGPDKGVHWEVIQ